MKGEVESTGLVIVGRPAGGALQLSSQKGHAIN
jgi:hypothetical protein